MQRYAIKIQHKWFNNNSTTDVKTNQTDKKRKCYIYVIYHVFNSFMNLCTKALIFLADITSELNAIALNLDMRFI